MSRCIGEEAKEPTIQPVVSNSLNQSLPPTAPKLGSIKLGLLSVLGLAPWPTRYITPLLGKSLGDGGGITHSCSCMKWFPLMCDIENSFDNGAGYFEEPTYEVDTGNPCESSRIQPP